MWNATLWKREWDDAKWLTLGACLLMFAFGWVFVWFSAQLDLGALGVFLAALPVGLQKLSPVPYQLLATPIGMVSLLYVDPVVLFTCVVWAIGRGSATVAGEIDRGTMEMMLAQPVSRLAIMLCSITVTIIGACAFAFSVWLGNAVGLSLAPLDQPISNTIYIPAAMNLFCTTYCLAGLTTFVSSMDRYRWRTVAIAGGFFLIELILKVVARMWAGGGWWLKYSTLFTCFEPQSLTLTSPEMIGALTLQFNGTLMLIGTVAFIMATLIFVHRDIPAPV